MGSRGGGDGEEKGALVVVLKSGLMKEKDLREYGGKVFRLKKGQEKSAVLHFKDFGPVWGHGHDLSVFSLSDNGMDTQCCCRSYSFTSRELMGGWTYCQLLE